MIVSHNGLSYPVMKQNIWFVEWNFDKDQMKHGDLWYAEHINSTYWKFYGITLERFSK